MILTICLWNFLLTVLSAAMAAALLLIFSFCKLINCENGIEIGSSRAPAEALSQAPQGKHGGSLTSTVMYTQAAVPVYSKNIRVDCTEPSELGLWILHLFGINYQPQLELSVAAYHYQLAMVQP